VGSAARGAATRVGTLNADATRAQGRPGVSRFSRLARTHALLAAADASMAGVLAGSVFFSLSPDAARPKVLLYLLIAAAPMAIIAPLIGPTVDRIPGGRRVVIQFTAVSRAALFLIAAGNVDSLFLFPLVLCISVMQKTYAISRSALVPLVVNDENELVEANSKLSIIGLLSAGLVVGPLGGLSKFSPYLALVPGAALCIAAALSAQRLPRDPVAVQPAARQERIELRAPSLVLAAAAMALIRAAVGFLLFHLFFFMREPYGIVWLGVALGASSAGSMLGNVLAPAFRRAAREEVMLSTALGAIALAGAAAAVFGGVGAAVALPAVTNMSSSIGRLAFDSIVQRSAPGANQGRAFAQFEARFQLSWVLAGVPPVLFTLPGRVGFAIVGGFALFAGVTYLAGSKAVAAGRSPAPSLAARAKDRARDAVKRGSTGATTRPEPRPAPRSIGPASAGGQRSSAAGRSRAGQSGAGRVPGRSSASGSARQRGRVSGQPPRPAPPRRSSSPPPPPPAPPPGGWRPTE
jgi:hypothetical protein